MTRTRKTQLSAVFGALAFVLVAVPAIAQSARNLNGATGAPNPSAAIEARATALFESPARWAEAAGMLTHAARLRATGDPDRARMLATAGRLYAYVGHPQWALYWMQEAGEQALAGGDVLTAAEAYTQAAYIAAAQHDAARVTSLAKQVFTLSNSPLLSEPQRTAIRAPFEAMTLAAEFHK